MRTRRQATRVPTTAGSKARNYGNTLRTTLTSRGCRPAILGQFTGEGPRRDTVVERRMTRRQGSARGARAHR